MPGLPLDRLRRSPEVTCSGATALELLNREDTMRLPSFLSLAFAAAAPAWAQQQDAVPELTKELKTSGPSPWEVRVRWRDGQLLASITPWRYHEAFKLWYDQTRLAETLRELCPKENAPVWALMKPGEDILLEPTVGGKSGVAARISCRKVLQVPS
jgi:hypothetical protein